MATLTMLDPPKSPEQQAEEAQLEVAQARRPFTTGQKLALVGAFGAAGVAVTVLVTVLSAIFIIVMVIHTKLENDRKLDADAARSEVTEPAARRGYGPVDSRNTGGSLPETPRVSAVVTPAIQIDDRPLPLPAR